MDWDSGLLTEQRDVVCKTGCHICLLAGPGTGKTTTLSRRVVYLAREHGVSTSRILALTFTRAAAHELRLRVARELDSDDNVSPRISTLHSFALSQLLHNAPVITVVPRPLRIADDWEERYIIQEDLKVALNSSVGEVRSRFHKLSADWETLVAEGSRWEAEYPDPAFLGAWQKHRETYGYMLRSELVFRLKKSIEQNPDFTLEQSFEHILVDEYQDLNKCDIEVIRALTGAGGQLFVAGDDDQSIYGFRFAFPQGIRNFGNEYTPCKVLTLEQCVRCDADILELGLFIARLDPNRIEKSLRPLSVGSRGEVHLLNFQDQDEEAEGVALICRHLIADEGVEPGDILVLTRTDRYGVYSNVVCDALNRVSVPVARSSEVDSPLDRIDGRTLLSLLRLCVNKKDHLAWRTLLSVKQNGIGSQTLSRIYEFAANKGLTFVDALTILRSSQGYLGGREVHLARELDVIDGLVSKYAQDCAASEDVMALLAGIAESTIQNEESRNEIIEYLRHVVEVSETKNVAELLATLSASLGDMEQEIDKASVNVLTMHKAKGLTADTVFIVGAEDEYLPDDQLGEEKEGDERRLLYVSMTRARHRLFVTYCARRTDRQLYTGRHPGRYKRTLLRFLQYAPLKPENGKEYSHSLS